MTGEFNLAAASTEALQEELDRRQALLAETGVEFKCVLTMCERPGGEFTMKLVIPGAGQDSSAAVLITLARDCAVRYLSENGVDADSSVTEHIDHHSIN